MTKKQLFQIVIDYFQKNMPVAETELNYGNPYELVVSVILSAQCTDVRVNKITPDFFLRFPTPEALKAGSQEEVFELIKSCSYPNNKSKHLIGMAKVLVDEFNSVVPDNIELLQKMPGVGRKTANVIASVVYDKPALAVDTHVFRVSARLGLTKNAKTPLHTEKQLVENFPENLLSKAHHWLILHGRYICKARKPLCDKCGLTEVCAYYKKISL
ncbi:MAG TPA: endonuclease III [Bacteroidetes bacterium]|nr:endonuclease III [Bacteroidota bacterium]